MRSFYLVPLFCALLTAQTPPSPDDKQPLDPVKTSVTVLGEIQAETPSIVNRLLSQATNTSEFLFEDEPSDRVRKLDRHIVRLVMALAFRVLDKPGVNRLITVREIAVSL